MKIDHQLTLPFKRQHPPAMMASKASALRVESAVAMVTMNETLFGYESRDRPNFERRIVNPEL